jgi:hypothetical protein
MSPGSRIGSSAKTTRGSERIDCRERHWREEVDGAQRLELALGGDGLRVEPLRRPPAGDHDRGQHERRCEQGAADPEQRDEQRREHRPERDGELRTGLGDGAGPRRALAGYEALDQRLARGLGVRVPESQDREADHGDGRGGGDRDDRQRCRDQRSVRVQRRREAPAREQHQRAEAADQATGAPRRVQGADAAGAEPDELDRATTISDAGCWHRELARVARGLEGAPPARAAGRS